MSPSTHASDFFVAGGTLRLDAPSYVKRPADEKLFNLALAGEFCYVLTPRQMGKSSLMVRTASRLQEQAVSTAIIDLTEIGTVAVDQWYLGLLSRLKRQLRLSVDPEAWWQERASLGRVQRFTDFLRDVILTEIEGQVVVFIDEIDTTLKLDFTDDFFAAIRAIYNARADDPEFKRLTFVLLGVATPADLIKDRTRTPFNIGQGITLREFSPSDAAMLQAGLEAVHPGQGEVIFTRIYHWMNGHPYLTQKLCLAVAETEDSDWNDERVDRLVEKLFLSEKARKETNLQFVRDGIKSSPNRRRLLTLYRQVYKGQAVPDDERSLDKNRLKLLGLVKSEDGVLRMRNEIYRRVFNLEWIKENTPVDWTRRIAIASTVIALLLVGFWGYFILSRPQSSIEARAQTFMDTFQGTTSADVRVTNLAGLFQIPGYEDRARQLFYQELGPEEQRALFEEADPQGVGTQLVTVAKGLYMELENNHQDNQLLEAMAQPLRQLDDPMAVNLATEIEQWVTGRRAYAAGEYQQAVDAYSVAISLNDRNPGTCFDQGLAYVALGEPSQALADFETVLRLDEDWGVPVRQAVVGNGQLYATLWNERGTYPALAMLVPTPTSTPTSTSTPTNTPTSTSTPTSTPTSTSPPTPMPTPTPTSTPTDTPIPPTPIPTTTLAPTVVPPSAGPIALTIYLRDTRTETGLAALSGDQVHGGMIYEEGHFVYGEAAVQIGATTYHFDKPEAEPGEPEQLPDPWRVEFEFAEELVARTGNQAGFDSKKAQFWVGPLDGDSAAGEERPYSLTMKLYEGNELRKSIRVLFTVKDAPESPRPEGGKPAPPPP
jgi:tetratricopeptide (TPR) repeat protein